MHRAKAAGGRRGWLYGSMGAAAAGLALMALAATPGVAGPDDDAALERARTQVKMLDDLYKNAVVSVTKIYKDGPPAIMVAKQVFGAMRESGHHDAKLVDATGSPLNEANEPQTEFEKRAADAMRAGKPYYEEVSGEGDARRLLVATVVPAVLPRCASCHGVDEGDLLGFIRYDLPVK
jgi:hypothetical protein